MKAFMFRLRGVASPWARMVGLVASAGALAGAAACSGAAVPPAPVAQPAAVAGAVPRAGLAFTHVRVFDGEHTLADATVLVDGDRIVAVGPGIGAPAGAVVVDGRGETLLPGLIDAHVHVHDAAALEQSLAFGVTTVLDMFAAPEAMKRLRAEDRPDRADLRSAGILATAPGGHGTEYGLAIPTLTAPEQAGPWVDARIAEGSDYIKIVFEDGRAYKRAMAALDTPTFTAVVEAAHRRGKLAVVHISDYDHARLAIDQGADGLVHMSRDRVPEADFGARVAAHHAFVTPTLTVTRGLYGGATQLAKDPAIAALLGPEALGNLEMRFPFRVVGEPGAAEQAVAQLRDAHAQILCGSDAPNPGTAYGATLHEELALLVTAGLSASAALIAATSAPASRFGLTDRGRIAVGARADLLLVDGDPTVEITATRRIAGIWRGGHRFDRDGYRARVAAAPRDAEPEAPQGELGMVSDFEAGPAASFGRSWAGSAGPGSKAAVAVVAGAHGSKGALGITGEVVANAKMWAGAIWMPGAKAFAPVNLSGKQGFSFAARGDGKPYVVMVFARKRRFVPAVQSFQPGAAFATVRFTWSQFDDLDGKDVAAIFIGGIAPGPVDLAIDDFQLQ